VLYFPFSKVTSSGNKCQDLRVRRLFVPVVVFVVPTAGLRYKFASPHE